MPQLPDVSQLDRELDAEKALFFGLKRDLRASLAGIKAPQDLEEQVISHAEEFGAAHTIDRLAKAPKTFDLAAAPDAAVLHLITPKVAALIASSTRMDALLAKRENTLAAADPKRSRVFIAHGREFTVDAKAKVLRYLDDRSTAPLQMTEVRARHAPKRAKQRESDRER